MMNMPGFFADASLQTPTACHYTTGPRDIHATRVVPQLAGSFASCILTTDGGKWCCVHTRWGPFCWKVPPPDIIEA
jgi:hypothetical protein